MKAIGTIVTKSGHILALFQVKPELIDNSDAIQHYRKELRQSFTSIPIVLISMKDDQIVFDGQEKDIQLLQNEAFEKYHWRGYDL